ncbi:hypothetical protein DL96DRAFT_1685862 [Flagelloscypha sp. PMI_526]|nr:hypothetical protein DL96DRAFT_1685862 [Flagelloscypha sp. PMI_526]
MKELEQGRMPYMNELRRMVQLEKKLAVKGIILSNKVLEKTIEMNDGNSKKRGDIADVGSRHDAQCRRAVALNQTDNSIVRTPSLVTRWTVKNTKPSLAGTTSDVAAHTLSHTSSPRLHMSDISRVERNKYKDTPRKMQAEQMLTKECESGFNTNLFHASTMFSCTTNKLDQTHSGVRHNGGEPTMPPTPRIPLRHLPALSRPPSPPLLGIQALALSMSANYNGRIHHVFQRNSHLYGVDMLRDNPLRHLKDEELRVLATSPPTKELFIFVNMNIRSVRVSNPAGVTVADVLKRLKAMLVACLPESVPLNSDIEDARSWRVGVTNVNAKDYARVIDLLERRSRDLLVLAGNTANTSYTALNVALYRLHFEVVPELFRKISRRFEIHGNTRYGHPSDTERIRWTKAQKRDQMLGASRHSFVGILGIPKLEFQGREDIIH